MRCIARRYVKVRPAKERFDDCEQVCRATADVIAIVTLGLNGVPDCGRETTRSANTTLCSQGLARDLAGIIGCEKDRDFCDVGRLTKATKR